MTDIFAGLRLDGSLTTDPGALGKFAQDFGGIVTATPRAVLHAGSDADIATVLRFAAQHDIPVAARGRAHTGLGQSQVRDGIVLDLTGLNQVHRIDDDRIVVDAGITWGELLTATLRHHRTPPVLTDYLGVSVGGTLSAGGIGGTSHRHGVQTDNVLALDVVTGDGTPRTCSPTEAPDLFHAVLGGFGRCGIIVRATLPLIPAPERVRRYKIYYPTAGELLARQRTLLHQRRFDFLQGEILPAEDGPRYLLDVATFYTPPGEPDDRTLQNRLNYQESRDATEDLSYGDFADRLADAETYLRHTGEWTAPHPWPNVLVPGDAADSFLDTIAAEATRERIGDAGLILVYPVFTEPLTTPLFRAPESPVVFLVAGLRFGPTASSVPAMLTANRQWFDHADRLGGTAYPIGAIPFTAEDWTHHLGDAQSGLTAAKAKYDPENVLRPGITHAAK